MQVPDDSGDLATMEEELASMEREACILSNPGMRHRNIIEPLGYMASQLPLAGSESRAVEEPDFMTLTPPRVQSEDVSTPTITGLALELCPGGNLEDCVE